MITVPLNDHGCLTAISEAAQAKAASAEVRQIAARFDTTRQLVQWIRTLPHREDTGDPADGPKVACDVPQRLRLPTTTPNCVERGALYLSVAEVIDAAPVRCLATVDTPQGRHTFPIEDGRPVVLDPVLPRNALAAGIDAIDRAAGRRVPMTFRAALVWVVEVVEEPGAARPEGRRQLKRARRAVRGVLAQRTVASGDLEALLWACALAEREAAWWGPARVRMVGRTVAELGRHLRTSPPPRDRVRLELLPAGEVAASVGKVAGRVAGPVALWALKAKLATYGVPPGVVDQVAGELAREREEIARRRERAPGRARVRAHEDRDHDEDRDRDEDHTVRRRRAIDHRAA